MPHIISQLGQLPLRKLVYRVLPLPESMYRYVYDFGTVTGKTENEYIEKIVKNQVFIGILNVVCI